MSDEIPTPFNKRVRELLYAERDDALAKLAEVEVLRDAALTINNQYRDLIYKLVPSIDGTHGAMVRLQLLGNERDDLRAKLSTTEKELEEARSERDEAKTIAGNARKNVIFTQEILDRERINSTAAQAANRERDARIEGLERALRGSIKKCHCRGTGILTRPCSLCGDSTFDHECNDDERPCIDEDCINARRALAQQPDGPTAEVQA